MSKESLTTFKNIDLEEDSVGSGLIKRIRNRNSSNTSIERIATKNLLYKTNKTNSGTFENANNLQSIFRIIFSFFICTNLK